LLVGCDSGKSIEIEIKRTFPSERIRESEAASDGFSATIRMHGMITYDPSDVRMLLRCTLTPQHMGV
jgi:hypothetical protein